MISCPKCSQQMKPLDQGSIPVCRCVNCNGLWLEPKILTQCIEDSPQHNMLNISLNSPPPGKGRPAGLGCPGCDGIMLRHSYHGVELERCPTCSGLYFDSGVPRFRQARASTVDVIRALTP